MVIGKKLRWVIAAVAGIVIASLVLLAVAFNSSIGGNFLQKEIYREGSLYGVNIEIGSFSPHLVPLSFDIRNITIRSQAAVTQPPVLYSKHVEIGVRFLPLLRGKLQLSHLQMDEPVIRLRIDAQGGNNYSFSSVSAPTRNSGSGPPAALFDLEVGDCSIRSGELFYNDASVPLDAALYNLRLTAAYSLLSGQYKGSLGYERGIWSQAGLEPISHSLQLDFAASSSALSISSLRLNTPSSSIALSGHLSNYSDPVIDANYQATVATQEIAAILKKSGLPSGTVGLEGAVAYHFQPSHSFLTGLVLQGKLRAEELTVRNVGQPVRLRGISAEYEMKEANLKVGAIAANILGGSLSGNAEFDTIDSAAPSVRLDGSLRKLSLATVSDTFAPPSVRRIPLAGSADLHVQASWVGFRDWAKTLVASGTISVSDSGRELNAQVVPLKADVVVDYDGRRQVISFGQSYVQTRNSRVSISGSLAPSGAQSGAIAINVSTGDLKEVASLAGIVRTAMEPGEAAAQLPDIGGSAAFSGNATGTLQAPRLQGTLTGQNLAFSGTRWRSLRADLTAGPSEFRVSNAFLTGNSREQVTFTGQAGLHQWSFGSSSPVSVQAKASGITVGELAQIAQFRQPLTGAVTANISIVGTRASPEGTATVTVANGSAWNEPVTKLLLDGKFHDGEIRSAINLQIPAGDVTANVSYTLATQAYALQLHGGNLQLDRIKNLEGRNVQGAANISAEGNGSLTDPRLEADFTVPRLETQGQTISNIAANINVSGQHANVSLKSTVDEGAVTGTADIALSGDYLTKAKVDVTALPVAAVAANFVPAQSAKIGGQTELHLTLMGPLSTPAAMEGHLQIPTLNVTFGGGQMGLAAPLEADYRNGVLTVANSTIQGTGTNLTFAASIPLKNSTAYSLSADGTMDLGVLHQFVPGVKSQGEIDVHIASQGTPGQPTMRGQLEVKNAAFSSDTFPASVEGLSGAIALSGNRAVITNFSGSVGGGKVSASGSVDLGRDTHFALVLNAQSVRIRYPQGLRSILSAQLNAQGTPRDSSVVGRMTVDSLSFTQTFDFATFLGSLSEESGGASASPFQEKVKLNVAVQSAQELSLASSRLSIGGAANLNITGTLANPVLLGRLNLNSGEIFYLGKRFELQNGTIEFANPARTDPVLNLYISTTVEQYAVTLKLAGTVDRLRTTYTSEPSMSQADIIHLLAFGNTTAEAASAAPASAAQNAEAVLAQGVTSPLAGKLQSLTGISQLSIDPLATNAYGDPGAQIAIQQRVTGSLLFTFSTNVTTTQNQAASLRYDVSKRLSVTILRDQNGGYGVDVRVHKAF